MRRTMLIAAVAGFAACTGSVQAAKADPVADFYKGKTGEMIIGTRSGGAYDIWARMFSKYLTKYLPGNPRFIAKNMPGAGHIKATNYVFNQAPKDGTTIAMFSRNMPTQAVLKHPAVKFDPLKFNWIGSPELTNRICVANKGAKVQKAEQLFTTELLNGGAGSGTAISTTPRLLGELLGLKFKLIEGYGSGTEVVLAMERGEVDGICQSLPGLDSTRPDWINSGKVVVLFNLEKKPVPRLNAPTIFSLTKTQEQRDIIAFYNANAELGRPLVAPPGVPQERVDALRKAFLQAMKDPDLLKEAAKQKLPINVLTGEEVEAGVRSIAMTPQAIVDKTDALIQKFKKKARK